MSFISQRTPPKSMPTKSMWDRSTHVDSLFLLKSIDINILHHAPMPRQPRISHNELHLRHPLRLDRLDRLSRVRARRRVILDSMDIGDVLDRLGVSSESVDRISLRGELASESAADPAGQCGVGEWARGTYPLLAPVMIAEGISRGL